MIDFWELSGRLLLMDPAKRTQDIYINRMPIQSDGCILLGHCQTATLPFSIPGYYDVMRNYFEQTYAGANAIFCPAISMFALGEIGTMFFTQRFRDLFEAVSSYLRTQSGIQGKTDTGSSSFFYMVLMLLVIDRTTRASVAQGVFLGLTPPAPAEQAALTQLATDPQFIKVADNMCLGDPNVPKDTADWTEGSFSVLRGQLYGRPGTTPLPFRHFRFIAGIN